MPLDPATNKNIPPVVFILLDAFRWDYLQPEITPTLWKLKNEGIYAQKLRPSFGFCEIAESSTGVRPDTSGLFTQLTFLDTKLSVSKRAYLSTIEKLAKAVAWYGGRGSTKLGRLLTVDLIKPLLSDIKVDALRYNIPLQLLPLLKAVEARRYTEPNAFECESCFDILTQNGLSIYDETYVINSKVSGPDSDRITQLMGKAGDNLDLLMIYLGGCDEFGHVAGPGSDRLQKAIEEQDQWIAQLIEAFPTNTRFLIVGDHGMVPVTQTVDVQEALSETMRGLVHSRDYILFLDSTLARVWWNNANAGRALKAAFAKPPLSELGIAIDKKEAQSLNIPAPGDLYGHIIWRANPGVMIYPDYFNNTVPVGMHGYPTDLDEQKGMAIVWGKDISQQKLSEVELIDICPTICDLFQLPFPAQNQGQSLLAYPG